MDEQKFNYDAAGQAMLHSVFLPRYFEKLSSYGIRPASEVEALKLVELADKIRYTDELEQAKGASEQAQVVEYANLLFNQALGLQSRPADPELDKQAAALLQDGYLRDAALICQDGVRQAVA